MLSRNSLFISLLLHLIATIDIRLLDSVVVTANIDQVVLHVMSGFV